jgi:hypothetical protein
MSWFGIGPADEWRREFAQERGPCYVIALSLLDENERRIPGTEAMMGKNSDFDAVRALIAQPCANVCVSIMRAQ